MKYAIIFDGEGVQLYIIESNLLDLGVFNGLYIGSGQDPDLEDRLCHLIYDEDGEYKNDDYFVGPFQQAILEGAEVVLCGDASF